VITYGDVDKSDKMDSDLRSYLNLHLYVKFEDPRFWQKLVYAMPHQNRNICMNNSPGSSANEDIMEMEIKSN
jgi:hypothetical protein